MYWPYYRESEDASHVSIRQMSYEDQYRQMGQAAKFEASTLLPFTSVTFLSVLRISTSRKAIKSSLQKASNPEGLFPWLQSKKLCSNSSFLSLSSLLWSAVLLAKTVCLAEPSAADVYVYFGCPGKVAIGFNNLKRSWFVDRFYNLGGSSPDEKFLQSDPPECKLHTRVL